MVHLALHFGRGKSQTLYIAILEPGGHRVQMMSSCMDLKIDFESLSIDFHFCSNLRFLNRNPLVSKDCYDRYFQPFSCNHIAINVIALH